MSELSNIKEFIALFNRTKDYEQTWQFFKTLPDDDLELILYALAFREAFVHSDGLFIK